MSTSVPRTYDWHPAATAPRDGTDIRIRCEQRPGKVTTRRAAWSDRAEAWIDGYGARVTFELWTEYLSPREQEEADFGRRP